MRQPTSRWKPSAGANACIWREYESEQADFSFDAVGNGLSEVRRSVGATAAMRNRWNN